MDIIDALDDAIDEMVESGLDFCENCGELMRHDDMNDGLCYGCTGNEIVGDE